MRKQEFLAQLRKGLAGLSQKELEERLIFYSEMIDDRMEEGLSEAEAVAQIGSVDDIVAQILADVHPVKVETKPNRGFKAWEIVLLVLGAPLWLPLLIAAAAILIAVYSVIFSVVVTLLAVDVSLIACAFGGVAAAAVLALQGNGLVGLAMLGAGIFCAGLAIFLFFGCKAVAKGIFVLTREIALWIKNCFVRKEAA